MSPEALIVWLRAEIDSEEFDRSMPGFWRHGDWIPFELGRAQRFAAERFQKAREELERLEIPREVSNDAKRYAQSLSLDRAREELAYLLRRQAEARGKCAEHDDCRAHPELARACFGSRTRA